MLQYPKRAWTINSFKSCFWNYWKIKPEHCWSPRCSIFIQTTLQQLFFRCDEMYLKTQWKRQNTLLPHYSSMLMLNDQLRIDMIHLTCCNSLARSGSARATFAFPSLAATARGVRPVNMWSCFAYFYAFIFASYHLPYVLELYAAITVNQETSKWWCLLHLVAMVKRQCPAVVLHAPLKVLNCSRLDNFVIGLKSKIRFVHFRKTTNNL